MILAVIVGAVDVTCGSVLNADHLVVCKIINCENVGIFGNDDDLDTGCIRSSEVYVLLTLFGNCKACHSDIGLAALYGSDNGAELHVVNYELKAELACDLSSDLNVDAFEAVVVGDHLIGRESSVGCHVENACLNSGHFSGLFGCLSGSLSRCGLFCRSLCLSGLFLSGSLSGSACCGAAAASDERDNHHACQKHCKILFHFKSSLMIRSLHKTLWGLRQ